MERPADEEVDELLPAGDSIDEGFESLEMDPYFEPQQDDEAN